MATTALVCTDCGHRSIQWLGRCPACKAWDSFTEDAGTRRRSRQPETAVGFEIGMIALDHAERLATGICELDRVLGGGLVAGSAVLLAGEPGVGKSTLVLQAAAGLEQAGKRVVIVCGEESLEQVATRARRLGGPLQVRLTGATDPQAVAPLFAEADVVMVDSVQTLRHSQIPSEPGSVAQVRTCAAELTAAARAEGTALVLVGHITKDGSIAGPRALEHLVDTVLTFEGDRAHVLRTVRTVKNRFGPAAEMGVFEMGAKGLSEVPDASRFFLAERPESAAGSSVGCILEGRRPVAVEIQALAASTSTAFPRRVAQGLESARLGVSLAVLERRAQIDLSRFDVYASVVGGLRAAEPGIDLALCLALASARRDVALPDGVAAVGEVGLGGEVRSVAGIQLRCGELKRLGFTKILVPAGAVDEAAAAGAEKGSARLIAVRTIAGALAYVPR